VNFGSGDATPWGSLRDVSNTGVLALQYAEYPGAPANTTQAFRCFAKKQADYVLGHNDLAFSYMIGYTR
jgi:hypothetical protein